MTTITCKCPVRGHNHDLVQARRIVSVDNDVAFWMECPQNGNRWFWLGRFAEAGRTEMLSRIATPRWGWASVDKKMDKTQAEVDVIRREKGLL